MECTATLPGVASKNIHVEQNARKTNRLEFHGNQMWHSISSCVALTVGNTSMISLKQQLSSSFDFKTAEKGGSESID